MDKQPFKKKKNTYYYVWLILVFLIYYPSEILVSSETHHVTSFGGLNPQVGNQCIEIFVYEAGLPLVFKDAPSKNWRINTLLSVFSLYSNPHLLDEGFLNIEKLLIKYFEYFQKGELLTVKIICI